MHADYTDILRRVQQAPLWWDANGVPRFDRFRPEDSPNLYAEECVLLRVACPVCGAAFRVEVNSGPFRRHALRDLVRDGQIAYTSPPRHDCPGDSRQSHTLAVVEFWRRDDLLSWLRERRMEGSVVAGEVVG
jgi:hypothetical protein